MQILNRMLQHKENDKTAAATDSGLQNQTQKWSIYA